MTELSFGWTGKILRVNLTKGKVKKSNLDKNLAYSYIGGRGFGNKILYDELVPRIDPLSPENLIILSAGPCNGTLAPCSTRLTVTTKSPLTGLIGDGNFGSTMGVEMKYAGYDTIIIEGKASSPSYLWIDDDDIKLMDASHLWGRLVCETEKMIKKELGDPHVCVAAIGPAGENLVKFATILAERGARSAGRGGIGAVMGSKMLKAIAVRGTKGVKVANNALLEKTVNKIKNALEDSTFIKNSGIYGPANALLVELNRMGSLIVKNYQTGTVGENVEYLSHNELLKYLVASVSCFSCPIHCMQFYTVDRGPYVGTYGEGLKFTNLQQLGFQIGVKDMDFVLKLNTLCAEYGLDVANLAGVIGYVMECYEKEILSASDIDGIEVKWGDHEAILKMINIIVQRRGIGNTLAEGLKKAPYFVGKESEAFALHVKGMSFTSSDPRGAQGWALAMAVASRGADHMRACVSAERQVPYCYTIERKGELIALFEDLRAIEDCLITCKFVFWKYMEDIVEAFRKNSKAFEKRAIKSYLKEEANLYRAATGVKINLNDLIIIGERIINLERIFNLREGLTKKDDTLPERFLKQPLPEGASKGKIVKLTPMLNEYYKVRGWDKETGVPSNTKLKELNLIGHK